MFDVHPASGIEWADAAELVLRKYAKYGDRPELPKNGTTFAICDGGRLMGTVTAVYDAPLPVERLYSEQIEGLRATGSTLVELTRFAFEDWASPSVLSALFKALPSYQRFCTDLVIDIFPYHRRFYERRFGFECLASASRFDTDAIDSCLMRMRLDRPAY